ncbi:prepilin-type N-terminal cleavage/methylation domain-containing protein [Vibrio vulnificus]|nr:prepilin-type N-terminal cleavage/methylation domain-containing protein [Vibrio vulnificus]POC53173.1 V10 pilin [Vibrio vulnificus]POC64128.1 V10 pilin [Vibrio vulnificus]
MIVVCCMYKKFRGFTLIELIVVIVLVAVLAVVAAPRFLNLQSDARRSVVEGLAGAVTNAAEMAYGKTAVEGMEELESYHVPNYGIVQYGYPSVSRGGMESFLQIDTGYHDLEREWVWAAHNNGSVSDPDWWIITQSQWLADGNIVDFNKAIEESRCYVKYTAAMEPGADFAVETITDGC